MALQAKKIPRRLILAGADEHVGSWVAARCPDFTFSGPYTTLGLATPQGVLLAGVVFDNYLKAYGSIQMHAAAVPGRRWLTRAFLGECFRYPFEQLDCRRIVGLVRSSNLEARRFDEGLGFVKEGIIREAYPNGDDMIIYGMLRRECRHLKTGQHHGETGIRILRAS
jgi:L-amino acid N-acyltransferase YncA